MGESISETLKRAKVSFSEDPDAFVKTNYGILGKAISIYSRLFSTTGCDSRTELEDLWSKHFIDPVIRDTVEDLLSVEEEWNGFLSSIDDSTLTISENSKLEAGSSVEDVSIQLTSIENEKQVSLRDLTGDGPSLFILLRHFA